MATVCEIEVVLPLAETLAAVRSALADLVVVIVRGLPAVERAMLLACVGPLSIELAPSRRLCALDVGPDAAEADVAAAVAFLGRADSTTGQVLAIGQVDPSYRVHAPSAARTKR